MLYTVGPRRRYKAFIEVWGNLYKQGRTENYPGGCVFQTKADARRYIGKIESTKEMGVFGLQASWGIDTEPSEDGWWHYLLKDRPILLLESSNETN